MLGSVRSWRRSYAFTLAATVMLVAAADYFFYGHIVGWTAALIAAMLIGALVFRESKFLASVGGRALLLASVGLLLALVEQPTWFNIAYLIMCLGALSLTNRRGWESDFVRWFRRWTRWAITGWTRLFLDNSLAARWLMRHGVSPTIAKKISGWSIPAILGAIFIGIFAWANPIISNWFSGLGDWLWARIEEIPDLLNPLRILFWLISAAFVWALLRGRATRRARTKGAYPSPLAPVETPSTEIAADLVVRCLIVFNVIFAVENLLDLTYLWGHHAMPTGTEYKQYVRRGAYPLVAAALMAGAFVLVTFRPGSVSEKSRLARRLVYVWIGQTILLTISAASRLVRYIDLTELTRLRVASAIWFVLVAIGLAYVIWRIMGRRDNRWLINVNALTALVILYPCCFVNFDGMIANFNAAHCSEAGGDGSRLDIEYFEELGPTSVAALDSVRDRITFAPKREQAQEISDRLHAQLDSELADWRGWTWRRQRTAEAAQHIALAKAKSNSENQVALAPADAAH
jgi:hypothetical protein